MGWYNIIWEGSLVLIIFNHKKEFTYLGLQVVEVNHDLRMVQFLYKIIYGWFHEDG